MKYLFLLLSCLLLGRVGLAQEQTNPKLLKVKALSLNKVNLQFNKPVFCSAPSVKTVQYQENPGEVEIELKEPLEQGIYRTLHIEDHYSNTTFDVEVVFNSTIPDLVISEIMYNNQGPDTIEFVEITNNGDTAIAMGGFRFTKGLTYTFPTLTLPGHQAIVIARYKHMVDSFFGITSLEWTDGKLSNNGERLRIKNSLNETVDSVIYTDTLPWPMEADGTGRSLVLCDLDSDNNDPANWRAADFSYQIGGLLNGSPVAATPGVVQEGCYLYSVSKVPSELIFSLYPNPTSRSVWVEREAKTAARLQVYDARGQLLQTKEIPVGESSTEVDIKDYPVGIYLLQLSDGKHSYTQKLVKE